jgi:hypothetical protein
VWTRFEAESPELAAAVKARFDAHPHHVIATVRADGAPRASGTNVVFMDDDLWIGCMPGAVKGADLRRDGRFSLHSAPLDEQLGDGDAKVSGHAVELSSERADEWLDRLGEITGQRPPGGGEVFRLDVERASLVELDGDHLVIRSWRPGEPTQRCERH